VALDTTILATAEGIQGEARKAAARELLRKLPPHATVVPIQALGELGFVLVRNVGRPPESARTALVSWHDTFPVIGTSADAMLAAADLIAVHEMSIWEAVMLTVAIEANCQLLLSENYTEGLTCGGITVTNPFSQPRHALLEMLINGAVEL
jgi:predicted nucleic acid-binding protein